MRAALVTLMHSNSTVTRHISQVRDAVASGVLIEVLFYTSHRLFHTRFLYRFHKQHHSFKAHIALAALYAHPVQAMLGNTLAVMAPAYIVSIRVYSWL